MTWRVQVTRGLCNEFPLDTLAFLICGAFKIPVAVTYSEVIAYTYVYAFSVVETIS